MAITAQTKVLTLDWWKPADKVQPGDYVFDKDGKIVQVTLAQQYRSEQCYEVTLSDHLSVCGDQHLSFHVETPKYRKRLWEYIGKFKFRRPLTGKSTEELLEESLRDERRRLLYSIPTTKPLRLPHQTLPVPPFIFGFWFFNRKSHKKLTLPVKNREEILQRFKDHGYKVKLGRNRQGGGQEFTVFPTIESQLAPNIPSVVTNNYLLSDTDQRIDLLSGIILSKSAQYNEKKDEFRVTSYNFGTIVRIQALAESLGCKTTIHHTPQLGNYTIFFKTGIKLVSNQVSPPVKVHYGRRYITKITSIPAQMCVHLETNGKDNSVLVGEGFISCH